jgi:hypothetical protein
MLIDAYAKYLLCVFEISFRNSLIDNVTNRDTVIMVHRSTTRKISYHYITYSPFQNKVHSVVC